MADKNSKLAGEDNMASNEEFVASEYRRIRRAAYALAGEPDDLEGRASLYLRLYRDSGGRNVFPLIAAHGAIWARRYLSKGMLAGRVLALCQGGTPRRVRARLEMIHGFAEAFRDINRRVCAEAYCAWYFTRVHGETAFARRLMPADLLDLLNACHRSQAQGREFPAAQRRALFRAGFLWEQATIATPAVEAAVAGFDWPLAKWFALRPCIRFAYFSPGQYLHFSDFSSESERFAQGAVAYAYAEEAGFARVEAALARRGIVLRVVPELARAARAGVARVRDSLPPAPFGDGVHASLPAPAPIK